VILLKFFKKLFQKNIYEDYIYNGFKKIVIIMIFIFIILGAVAYFNNLYFLNMKISNEIKDNRRLKTAFLFHFNQTVNPYADVGDKASYNRLIKTLRKHKNLKFNIHISGTLIQSLLWYNPETIELIKDGINDGQFEILGSTYSQNIMYSTDNTSNQWQIERHKEIINDIFGVTPTGFWNSERTWKQELADIIVKNGYKYTFIEDKTMKRSGSSGSEYFIRSTNKGKLAIVNDDNEFLEKVNMAVDAGDIESDVFTRGALLSADRKEYKKLFKYMRNIYEKDRENNYLLSYADDAEITGLWDFENGSSTEWDFKNLDFLLSEIENKKWIETVKYSDVVNKKSVKEDVTPVKDGAAIWMEKAARGYGNYSEKGYKSWFDFNLNSPKLAYYRKMHKEKIEFIKSLEKDSDIRVKNIYKLAKENFLVHQFEFGCTGISGTDEEYKLGDRYGMWENMRYMDIYSDVVENIKNMKDRVYEKDVNDDGIVEIVVINRENYYVFSKKNGGRILFWFDLNRGVELIGGEIGVQLAEKFYNGNKVVEPYSFKEFIQYSNDSQGFINYFEKMEYNVRTGGLNDKLKYSTEEINRGAISDIYDLELMLIEKNSNRIVFSYGEFKKEIIFTDTGFEINYIVPKKSEELTVSTEVSPDYYAILNQGKKAVKINRINQSIEIYNIVSNIGVKFEFSEDSKSSIYDSLHGYIITTKFKDKNPGIKIKKYLNK
jgi:hypothetical protein